MVASTLTTCVESDRLLYCPERDPVPDSRFAEGGDMVPHTPYKDPATASRGRSRWVDHEVKRPRHVCRISSGQKATTKLPRNPLAYHDSLLDFVMVCCGLQYPSF